MWRTIKKQKSSPQNTSTGFHHQASAGEQTSVCVWSREVCVNITLGGENISHVPREETAAAKQNGNAH